MIIPFMIRYYIFQVSCNEPADSPHYKKSVLKAEPCLAKTLCAPIQFKCITAPTTPNQKIVWRRKREVCTIFFLFQISLILVFHAYWLIFISVKLTFLNCFLGLISSSVKGVFSKPSGKCIVAPNLCLLSQRLQIVAVCLFLILVKVF